MYLVRSRARPLAKEFGPAPWSISLWIKQDERDTGKGDGSLKRSDAMLAATGLTLSYMPKLIE